MVMNIKEALSIYFAKASIVIDERKVEKLAQFYHILEAENQNYNLTAIDTAEDAATRHFVDSLMVAKCKAFRSSQSVLDVGSGAGFPGIPLAIVYPEKKYVLLDALQKRVGFLNKCIDQLQLNNVEAVHERAETFANNTQYREVFDLVTARAVAELAILCEYCLPAVRLKGHFVAMKSLGIAEELNKALPAIKILGGGTMHTWEYTLPDTRQRQLVVIPKVKSTPRGYPRRPGTPKKKPLMKVDS